VTNSVVIAKILGPVLAAFAIGLLLNRALLRPMADEILSSVTLGYMFGVLDLAVGLGIVIYHNLWFWHWSLIITLFGWIAVIRGLLRLFLPRLSLGAEPKFISREWVLTTGLVLTAAAGITLSYFAYVADH
jgi:hypothetical protein